MDFYTICKVFIHTFCIFQMNEFSYFKQDIFPVLATIFSRTVVSQIRCRIIYTTGNKVKVCVWRLAAGDLDSYYLCSLQFHYNFTRSSSNKLLVLFHLAISEMTFAVYKHSIIADADDKYHLHVARMSFKWH